MNSMAVLRATDDGWQSLDERSGWAHATPWPGLQVPTVVVLDLESSYTDVWRFEGKAEHALALIEKRVRTEGLVDGVAHVVVHRLRRYPGGFQVFFSAFALDVWQQMAAWAAAQKDHCLLLHAAALLCDGLSVGRGRVLLSMQRMEVFLDGKSGMAYAAARTVARVNEPLTGLASLLGQQVLPLLAGVQVDEVEVAPLVVNADVPLQSVFDAFAEISNLRLRWLTAPVFQGAGTVDWRASMPALAMHAAQNHVLNPGLARMAWKAESWLGRLTVVVALAAVGLMGMAWYVNDQVTEARAATQVAQRELVQFEERIRQVNEIEPSAQLLSVAEFARKLDEGSQLDPLRLLADLHRLTPAGIRIQRVKLEPGVSQLGKVFKLEGQAEVGDSSTVVNWTFALAQAGWHMKALDPSDTTPGGFAYEVVRDVPATVKGKA